MKFSTGHCYCAHARARERERERERERKRESELSVSPEFPRTKNQNMKNASRDSPQFSFGDLISFNNHLSFPSCPRPITEKTTQLPLFSGEAKSRRVSRLQPPYNMYLSVRFARARQRITRSAPISLALSRNARDATTCSSSEATKANPTIAAFRQQAQQ